MVGGASIKHRPCFSFRGAARNDGHAHHNTPPRDWRIQGDSLCQDATNKTRSKFSTKCPIFLPKKYHLKKTSQEFEKSSPSPFIRDDGNEILKSRTNTSTNHFLVPKQFTHLFYYYLINNWRLMISGFSSNSSGDFLITFFSQVFDREKYTWCSTYHAKWYSSLRDLNIYIANKDTTYLNFQ